MMGSGRLQCLEAEGERSQSGTNWIVVETRNSKQIQRGEERKLSLKACVDSLESREVAALYVDLGGRRQRTN